MIATVDISIQAANPSLPLFPMRAFEGSPSSIRIRNVPKRIGDWVIDKVYFAVTYPDNSTQTIECKLVGGVYVGTIAGCDTIGNVKNGYSIFADGKDENGNAVTDYCLGKGDVQILDARGIIQPLQNTTFVQILSAHPAAPNDGDMWYENDAWYVWQNGQAMPLGDDSAIIGNLSERVDELSAELSSKQDELTDAEQYALSDTVYDLATKFYFTDNTTSAFSWNKEEVTLEDFIEAGLVDENGTWIKQPRIIEVGKPVGTFHANAFAGCTNLYSVVFYGTLAVNVKRNYPWGISNTSIIQPFYNASQYWVEQKGYASTYPYQNVTVLPFGARVATLQPYKVNNLNFNSQAATFRVDVAGSTGTMRDLYFVFTVPSNAQPMTWNTYFDKFEGGDAASVAPTSGTNIYHIYEYASGKFAVEKFDNTYTKGQVDSALYAKQDALTQAQLSAIDSVVSGNYLTVKEAEEGYTEWVITPPYFDEGIPFDLTYQEQYGWVLGIRFEGGGEAIGFSYGPQDVTTLTYTNVENVGTVTATRCRITPTKTSQLSNDGSDGVHPFATIEDLTAYELKTDLSNDVSVIVTETSPVAEFTFEFVMGNPVNVSLYRAEKVDASDEPRYNIYYVNDLIIQGMLLADDMSYPQQFEDSLNQCTMAVTKTTEIRNALGLATYDQLLTKQDKLADAQISAIDSVVDERATVITFSDNTTSSFNWVGEINHQTIVNAGLYDSQREDWIKYPVNVKIGTGVTSIMDGAFIGCSELFVVIIPDTVTSLGDAIFRNCTKLEIVSYTRYSDKNHLPDNISSIGNYAFDGCSKLRNLVIHPAITSIGLSAFSNCTVLTNLIFKDMGTLQVQLLPNYPWGISDTSRISVWHDASQEWVTAQGFATHFTFNSAAVVVVGGRHTKLQPYKMNTLTLNSAVASYEIRPQGTAGTLMREYYYALTLGADVEQPITWASSVDVFQGGSASAIAPVAGQLNLYHIIEYSSGHFAAMKLI